MESAQQHCGQPPASTLGYNMLWWVDVSWYNQVGNRLHRASQICGTTEHAWNHSAMGFWHTDHMDHCLRSPDSKYRAHLLPNVTYTPLHGLCQHPVEAFDVNFWQFYLAHFFIVNTSASATGSWSMRQLHFVLLDCTQGAFFTTVEEPMLFNFYVTYQCRKYFV